MPVCPASIHVLRARITRLNPDGTVSNGGTTPKNSYVTAALTHLNWTTNVQAGDQRVVIGGSDCICVQYRGLDKLLNLALELEMCKLEAPLLEMMLGVPAIMSSGATPDLIGTQLGKTLQCGDDPSPVAIEVWSTAWEGAGQRPAAELPVGRFIRWVFPMTYWQIGNGSLQNDFLLPTLTGYTQDNANWGTGPYTADDVDVGPKAGWYLDDAVPDETNCDYAVAT